MHINTRRRVITIVLCRRSLGSTDNQAGLKFIIKYAHASRRGKRFSGPDFEFTFGFFFFFVTERLNECVSLQCNN